MLRDAREIRKGRAYEPIPRVPGRCIACGGPVSPHVACCFACEHPLVTQRTGLDTARKRCVGRADDRDPGWLEDVDAFRRAVDA